MHLLPRAWVVGIALAATAGMAAAAVAYLHSGHYGLPFEDSFVRGTMAEWTAYGGSWHIANGVIQNDSDDRGAKILTGSPSLADYQIDSDVQLTSRFGDAGVLLRVSQAEEGANAFDGYYVGVRLPDLLLVGKVDQGFRPLAQVTMRQPAQPNLWNHLRASMRGCDLFAQATDPRGQLLAEVHVEDADCYRRGQFGLRSFESGGMWRHVEVSPLR